MPVCVRSAICWRALAQVIGTVNMSVVICECVFMCTLHVALCTSFAGTGLTGVRQRNAAHVMQCKGVRMPCPCPYVCYARCSLVFLRLQQLLLLRRPPRRARPYTHCSRNALRKSSASPPSSSSRAHKSRTNQAYDTRTESNALGLPVRCAQPRFKRPLHTRSHAIWARLCALHQLKCHGFVRSST